MHKKYVVQNKKTERVWIVESKSKDKLKESLDNDFKVLDIENEECLEEEK